MKLDVDKRKQLAEQQRRGLRMFLNTLDEESALEVAMVYPPWKPGKLYKQGEYFTYGENSVGDPQLYKVNLTHTSSETWLPGAIGSESLYTAIGLDNAGYPVWSQPTGAHDAYNMGDIVNFNGLYYESLINGNAFSPEVSPTTWKQVNV